MGTLAVGSVVLLRFPFSDLSYKKYRPALVVAKSDFGNVIVAQITSKIPPGGSGTLLTNKDFTTGGLSLSKSYIRHNKLFTADLKIVSKTLGVVSPSIKLEIRKKLLDLVGELA